MAGRPEGPLRDPFAGVAPQAADHLDAAASLLESVTLPGVAAFFVYAVAAAAVVVGLVATIYRLARYLFTPRRSPAALTDLPPGDYWLKTDGVVSARGATADAAVGTDPAVAVRVRAWIQEAFTGLRFFRADVTDTSTVDATEVVPFEIDAVETDLVVAPGDDVAIVGRDWNSKGAFYWPDDEIPDRLAEMLADHGLDVEERIFEGAAFTHLLRLNEAVVRDGERAHLFGPVTVEATAGDGRRIVPRDATAVDLTLTTVPTQTFLIRRLRDLFFSAVGIGVVLLLAWLFWPELWELVAPPG